MAKAYLIKQQSTCTITSNGIITNESQFMCYERTWFGWKQLKQIQVFSDGQIIKGCGLTFKSEEAATEFIHNYHKNKNKIGKYTIDKVKMIKLE